MHLLPTEDEVVRILRETGALRTGHFLYPTGLHSDQYLQVPLAMRYYQHARALSVGLSRKLRDNPEIRAVVPQLSIVAPAPAGLPVAFGVCEALQAHQVYWAEREDNEPLHFRQYLEQHQGEPVILVDDILRSGNKLNQMKALLESRGAEVLGLAVVIYQPTPKTYDFGSLPFYYLAKLDSAAYYPDEQHCELCRRGVPLETVWV